MSKNSGPYAYYLTGAVHMVPYLMLKVVLFDSLCCHRRGNWSFWRGVRPWPTSFILNVVVSDLGFQHDFVCPSGFRAKASWSHFHSHKYFLQYQLCARPWHPGLKADRVLEYSFICTNKKQTRKERKLEGKDNMYVFDCCIHRTSSTTHSRSSINMCWMGEWH